MTQNRRIVLNIVATYGRSLYALVIGLFCGRWTLLALGEVDYGLMGVVGGLTGFITFFNGLLSVAISRYFAFSIGRASREGREGLEICRQWFSLAVFIHTLVPGALMVVGYPIGVWAVEHFLTIPPDRINACVWVFRFVCISCFVGMVNVPFTAMYQAKQHIAELTIYSFATSTLNVFALYYMVSHPGDWLAKFSFWTCLLGITPQIIITARALKIFPECRFCLRYCFDLPKLREIGEFVFWQFFGALGGLVRGQGMAILVNKYFGPALNATMNLANTVAGQTETLSNAMYGAFSPAITTSAGAGRRETMLQMSYRASKFGSVLCLIFILPLSLEINQVLTLWLKNPPPMLAEACLWTFGYLILGQILRGIDLCFLASGRIRKFMVYVGGYMTLTLPVAWLLVHFGVSGFVTVFVVLVAFRVFVGLISIPLAKKELGYSPTCLLIGCVVPISVVTLLGLMAGGCVVGLVDCSIWRIPLTALVVESVFLPSVWIFVLNENERQFVKQKILKKFKRGGTER